MKTSSQQQKKEDQKDLFENTAKRGRPPLKNPKTGAERAFEFRRRMFRNGLLQKKLWLYHDEVELAEKIFHNGKVKSLEDAIRFSLKNQQKIEYLKIENFSLKVKLHAISSTDRIGEKVFIFHAWEIFKKNEVYLTLEEFKEKLLECNRLRTLTLVRADLTGTMNKNLVKKSEIEYMNAKFHFIQLT